ncbi:MAG: endonuclease VIII [Pseudomonadota bacterium]
MPEGPEIKREAYRIAQAIEGAELEKVFFARRDLKKFQSRLNGARVSSVAPHGKAMLIHFDNEWVMYSHNQLYGRWFVRPRGELPKTNRTLRAALHSRDHSALLYSASEIEVLRPSALAAHPFLKKLGPDALDANTHWRMVSARLQERRFSGRTLGALLLDQSFVAGLGNYLRTEILFFAGLSPERKPRDLSTKERNRLAREILDVTQRAYDQGGVTNKPALVKKLKKSGAKRGGVRFSAFARANKPCYRCKTIIKKIEFSGRRLYVCGSCQV